MTHMERPVEADWGGGFNEALAGHVDPDFEAIPTREEIGNFARAIGETNPVFLDVSAARRAGYPDLPIPPTFHFSIGRTRGGTFDHLAAQGIDSTRLLHGAQGFEYGRPAFAGETLGVRRRIADYYSRKNDNLRFIVIETEIRRRGTMVSIGRETLIMPRTAPQLHDVAPQGDVEKPDGLPVGPVTREMLSAFASASGDLNRVHLDPVVARAAGYQDVFAHGMLAMAWMGRFILGNARLEDIREFGTRFLRPIPIGARFVVQEAEVTRKDKQIEREIKLVSLDQGLLFCHGNARMIVG